MKNFFRISFVTQEGKTRALRIDGAKPVIDGGDFAVELLKIIGSKLLDQPGKEIVGMRKAERIVETRESLI